MIRGAVHEVGRHRIEGPTDETGSGSLLGLAVIGCIVGVVLLTLPLYIGLAIAQATAGAADAAALAAADVASGLVGGTPCGIARTVATANAARVGECEVDGLVVTVRVDRAFLGLQLVATATAGPPDAVTN